MYFVIRGFYLSFLFKFFVGYYLVYMDRLKKVKLFGVWFLIEFMEIWIYKY